MEVTGLDLDPEMIERARANASRKASAGRLPTFVVGDVAALPFEANSFDAVVSTLSMHHWADPAVGLAEIAQVLHPDGRAFVWDIRPGAVPLHREAPNPVEHVHEAPLRLVDARPWRWPWRFRLTERIELAPLDRSAS
jgi:ubiquinone/menaquinone biosynthesis C-methylase UbiE